MRKKINGNRGKRIISTVIVGAMLCAGAAFGVTKYVNRDTTSRDGTDTSIVNTQGQSGDVTKADQTVYMTDFQKESAQKEAEIVADKVEDKKDTLTADQGLYAPDSIVLADTTKEEAERIAEKLGAEVRLTDDESFAVLYLPEGMTIDDVYNNDEYSQEITEMTPDYYVSVSALNQELALNPTGDKSKSETTTYSDDSQIDDSLPVSKVTKARPDYAANDPDFLNQQYLDYINLKNTWNTTKGSGVTVAVIDSGIDTDHPEFAGRISEKSYNASEDKIVKDYDISVIEDEFGHGTEVAGVLAASMDNNEGIVGVAPEVELLVIKCNVTAGGEFVRGSDAVFGLAYAIEADADVINMSFGSYEDMYSKYTELAVDSDIICVAAAGNDGSNMPVYPASLDSVIAVGAYDTDNETITDYSNYGENVDILAPGTTYTTTIGGGYTIVSGTSMSAPVAAGAAALYRSAFGKTEFTDMKQLFEASSVDIGIAGEDYYHGFGEVDVYALVCEEKGKITYDMMTDEIANQTQIFVKGHTVQTMPEPEREYLVFDGWNFDPNCEDACEYYTNVFNEDVTLYASWVNEDDGTAFTYVKNSDGTIRITSYTGKRRYVTVPSEIEGGAVTEIGENAFADNRRARSIELPASLQNIRTRAFANCTLIRSIDIPDSVSEIGEEAFVGCVRLGSANISDNSNLRIVGSKAFSQAGISEFNIPASLVSLGDRVFYGSTALRKIKVADGNSVYMVKNSALYNADGTSLLYYPSGLAGEYTVDSSTKSIGTAAFAYSRSNEVVLNDGLVSIGEEGFAYSRIGNIIFPASLETTGNEVCSNCPRLAKVEFANKGKLLKIANYSFYGTSALHSITIPNYIVNIGENAFCVSRLTSVNFEKDSKLIDIEKEAFSGTDIKTISIPDSVQNIGMSAFCSNINITNVDFGKKSECKYIGPLAFSYTYSLSAFTIPDEVTTIGSKALFESGITKIEIGAKLTEIGNGVFASCHNLSNITVDEKNEKYVSYDGVLYDKDMTILMIYPAARAGSYTLAETTESIDGYAFSGASKLNEVIMNEGLTNIGENAFEYCRKLQTPVFPSSLIKIGEYAFMLCDGMSDKLIIPKCVKSIGMYSFGWDYALTDIEFEQESVLDRIGYRTFAYCGIEDITIPGNVSTIAQEAFTGCNKLLTVTFEADSQIENLPAWVFDGADNLRRITFESGSMLKTIEARACEGLLRLENIDFTGCTKLTTIDNYAFESCISLGNITLPGTVTEIGRYAFYGCSQMDKMILPETLNSIGRYAFSRTKSINLYFMASVLPADLEDKWDDGIGAYYVGLNKIHENDEWVYAVTNDGKASIIKYKGSAESIDIDKIDGYEVSSIGSESFKDNTTLTNITLPDTLTGIYKSAFAGTTALTVVVIPDNVEVIDSNAFAGSGVTSVIFGDNSKLRTIGSGAFANTVRLDEINIPSGVSDVREKLFYNSSLKKVTLPDGITSVGRLAFSGSKLEAIEIPSSVTELGYSAFKDTVELSDVTFADNGKDMLVRDEAFYNTGIEKINIPENISYIGNLCFAKCKNLTDISVAKGNNSYASVDGVFYNKACTKLISCPAGKTGSYTVSDAIMSFATGAFEGSQLSEIIIPNESKLMTIGLRTFYGCKNLTHITIPDSVQSIEYYAFAYCDNLEQVDINASSQIGGIYSGAFYNCAKLAGIVIPDTVQEISDYAFYGCTALKEVTLTEKSKLQGVYDHAFEYAGIENFDMPADMVELGAYAFHGAGLKRFIFNDNLEEIGDYALADSGLTETETICIPVSVRTIGKGIFSGLRGIKELSIPFLSETVLCMFNISESFTSQLEELERISVLGNVNLDVNYAFEWLSVKEVYLADTITSVGECIFMNCKLLEHVNIPTQISEIPTAMFDGCDKISSISIPQKCTIIGNSAFLGCSKLQEIDLPQSIKTIKSEAFSRCESLQSFIIPSGCESIGEQAFYGCIGLKNIYISQNVANIGSGAFSGCRNLESIIVDPNNAYYSTVDGILYNYEHTLLLCVPAKISGVVDIPEGVITIGDNSFRDCCMLDYINFPNTLKFIGINAFSGSGVREIDMPNSVINIGRSAFEDCFQLTNAKISNSVVELDFRTFYGCYRLKEVDIGNNIKKIDVDCFGNCAKLSYINIPISTAEIGNGAFSGCIGLKKIRIPSNVSIIGDSVFDRCESLEKVIVDEDNKNYMAQDGIVYDKKMTSILFVPNMVKGKVVVPEGVKIISEKAFSGKTYITEIVLPNSVEQIGDYSFSNCSRLEKVYLGNNVKKIGENILFGSKCFYDLNMYVDDVLYVDEYALYYKGICGDISKKRIYIKEGTKLIADKAFNNSDMEFLYIPNSVEYIGEYSFYNCSKLKNVRWGKNIEYIGEFAFYECSNLRSVYLVNENLKIEFGAFGQCTVDSVRINSFDKDNFLNAPSSINVYVGLMDYEKWIDYKQCNNLVLLDDRYVNKTTRVTNSSTVVYANVDSKDISNKEWIPQKIYCRNEWNLVTFYVNGMVVSMVPLPDGKVLQTPAKSLIDEYIPEGANFIGWDVDSDGMVDELPANVSSDLEVHAVYNASIQSINIKEAIILEVDQEYKMGVDIEPIGYNQNDKLIWVSDNEDVAIVDDGNIIGVSEGKTKIKAILAENENIYAECNVCVTPKTFGIELIDKNVEINVDDSYVIKARINVPEDEKTDTKYESVDSNIAYVDNNGVIKGISPGQTLIRIENGKYEEDIAVSVKQPITNVSINKSEIDMTIGETSIVVADIFPQNTTEDKSMWWFSKNPEIANINSQGVITAISEGDTEICGIVGEYTVSCIVTVVNSDELVRLNEIQGTLRIDETQQLEMIYMPSNSKIEDKVTWCSMDPNIAHVDENGLVSGVNGGNTVIYGCFGEKTATYSVTVVGIKDSNTGITVTNSDNVPMYDEISIDVDVYTDNNEMDGYNECISKLATDENGRIYNLLVYGIYLKYYTGLYQPIKMVDVDIPVSKDFISENTKVYRYEGRGVFKDISYIFNGERLSFATSTLGIYCIVVPTDKYQAAKVEIDKESVNVCVGNTATITAIVLPENAEDKKLTYVSDDEKIVTVDENGKLTAISAGKTTIIVKSAVDGVQAIVDVSVTEHEWSDGKVTTDPTCTDPGVKTFTCDTCGETRTEEIKAAGHIAVDDDAVAPTCTKTGLTAGSHCSVCNEVLTAQEEIPALGHTWNGGEVTIAPTCIETGVKTFTCDTCGDTRTEEVKVTGHTVVDDEAVAPTCTKPGLTAGSHCSVCNEVLQAQEEVPAIGHTWNNGEITIAPTCTETGVKTFTCETCGDTRTEEVEATGHTVVVDNAVEPTCTKTGLTEGSHCSVCNEVVKVQEEIPALGHTWNEGEITTAPTCTETGVKTFTCDTCGETRTEEIKAVGHTAVDDEAVEPTCTKPGLTVGSHCSVCNEVIKAQEEVPALGHTWNDGEVTTAPTCTESGVKTFTCETCGDTRTEEVKATGHTAVDDEAVAPTCTKTGLTEGRHCSVCNEVLQAQEEIPALGHTWNDGEVTTEPTCIEVGVKTFTCDTCGETRTEEIKATGHTVVDDEAVAPTCTTLGLTAGRHCSVCNEVLQAQEEIPALGHTWNDGVVTTEPTCTEVGVKTFTCETCGETRTEEIKATGHTVVDDKAVAPTCTKTGLTAGSHCSVCNEVLQAQEEVPALGHTWNAGEVTTVPTCTETGVKTFTCETCGETRTEEIKATGHTVVDDEAVAPTCTKSGLTAGSHCSVCNEVLQAQEEIPALGHTWNDGEVTTEPTCIEVGVKTFTCDTCGETRTEEIKATGHTAVVDEAVAPTCTTSGLTAGSHCSVCNEVLQAQEEIQALGHTWNAGEVTTAPTCTETGVKTFTCETCGDTRTEKIKATGHTAVDDEAVAPTCTKSGLTAGSHCSVCNEVLQAQEEIPALGHTWNAGEVTTAPTYTTVGVKTFTCEICGETRTESIPKLSRIDISKATSKVKVSGISAKIYNGKSQTQSALVVTVAGKKLKKDTDYKVTYKNNKKIGTATITITGKNGYTGTVRKTFAIKTQVGKVYTTSLKYKVTNARVDGKGTVSVVGSVYKSGDRKFTTLKITDTVTIGGVKFKITRVEKNAFRGYKYLTTVTIGSNVTSVGDTAFYGCGKLTAVTVGKRVKTIGAKSFAGCKSLKRVKLLTTQFTKAGTSAFNGIKENATFALPKKYYNSYSKMIKKAGAPKKAVYKKF